MSMTGSFYIRPSSFKQALLCPASAFLPKSKDSEPARQGTVFHKLAVDKVRGIVIDKDGWDKFKRENVLTDDDIKEMAIALSRIKMTIPEGSILVTEGLYEGLDGKLKGTPDVVLFEGKKASIIDWKFGRVEVDEAENNYQGMCYAVLVYLSSKEDLEEVSFYIVQPRTNSISEKTYYKDDLVNMAKWIEEKYDWLINNSQKFNYGDACSSCFKSSVCPEFKARFQALATINMDDSLTDIEQVKRLLLMAKPIKSIIAQIEDHAKQYVHEHGELDCGSVVYTEATRNYDIINSEKMYEQLKNTDYIGKIIKFNKTLMYKHIPDAKNFLKDMEKEGVLYKKPTKYCTFKKKK